MTHEQTSERLEKAHCLVKNTVGLQEAENGALLCSMEIAHKPRSIEDTKPILKHLTVKPLPRETVQRNTDSETSRNTTKYKRNTESEIPQKLKNTREIKEKHRETIETSGALASGRGRPLPGSPL